MSAYVLVRCDCCGKQLETPFPRQVTATKAVQAGEAIPVRMGSPAPDWQTLDEGRKHYCDGGVCKTVRGRRVA